MRLTARQPTEAELAKAMSNKPVYKVVRVIGDGDLKSLWVRGTREEPLHIEVMGKQMSIFTLTYEEDKLSSNGKYGIWCCKTEEAAAYQVRANGNGLCAVFIAYPIGKLIETPRGWKKVGIVLYPSIILGEQVAELIGGIWS